MIKTFSIRAYVHLITWMLFKCCASLKITESTESLPYLLVQLLMKKKRRGEDGWKQEGGRRGGGIEKEEEKVERNSTYAIRNIKPCLRDELFIRWLESFVIKFCDYTWKMKLVANICVLLLVLALSPEAASRAKTKTTTVGLPEGWSILRQWTTQQLKTVDFD